MSKRAAIALAALSMAMGACGDVASRARAGIVPTVDLPVEAPQGRTLLAPADASCATPAADAARPLGAPGVGSTVALAAFGERRVALVADEDAREIRLVDIDRREEVASVALGSSPGQLMVLADGRVLVALRDRGSIAVLAAGKTPEDGLTPLCTREVAAEPVGLADSGDGVVVTSRWGRRVSVFDARFELRDEIAVARDPHGVAVAEGVVYVSHVVGGRMSIIDLASKKVRVSELKRSEEIPGSEDHERLERTGVQAYAVTPTEEGVAVPLMLVDPGDARASAAITGYGGGTSLPIGVGLVARFDRKQHKPRFEEGARADSCPLPRAAANVPGRREILVACQGTDEVVVQRRDGKNVDRNPRFPVAGGPTGVAVLQNRDDSHHAVVWSQFTSTLTLQPLAGAKAVEVVLSVRGTPDELVALGRKLFHDAGQTRISFDGRACASCHPDARDDGLTWATAEGPRQTPILLGRLEGSAPYGWNGDVASLGGHLRRTLRRLGGTGLTARERDALVAYINSIDAPGETRAVKDERVQRGAEIFASAATGCSGCHVDTTGTDRIRHDVGAIAPGDDLHDFDTPSLRHISQSAPYFHDGRYASLGAMLRDQHMKMGEVGHLSDDELGALAAYLETL